jgi:hypothetical protein
MKRNSAKLSIAAAGAKNEARGGTCVTTTTDDD